MKVLIIACHPDDEVLGCGGVIQKHVAQGDLVKVLIVTIAPSPEWSMEYSIKKLEEQKQVDKLLGIDKRHFFNLPALCLNTLERGRFNYKFYRIIEEVKPDIIYTHFNKELNEEHNLVSMATLVGSRIPNKATIYMYETPSVRYSLTPFKPNYYVEISYEQSLKKLEAFKLYRSEVKTDHHPRSLLGMTTLGLYRGDEVGVHFAEAFIQIRRIWLKDKEPWYDYEEVTDPITKVTVQIKKEVHKKGAQGYY